MPDYKSPGIYVEEVDKGTKPIEAAGTAVAAFIGFTEKADDGENDLRGKPTLVTNWSQYEQKFGGFVPGIYTPDSVYGYFANGGGRCYVVSLQAMKPLNGDESAPPAVTQIPSATNRNTPLLHIESKLSGAEANGLRVEIRNAEKPADAPAPSSDDDSNEDSASASTSARSSSTSSSISKPEGFNVLVYRGPKVVESFENLTIGRGRRNVATILNAQSQLLQVEVETLSASDAMPLAGTYNFEVVAPETKTVTVADYRGDVSQRRGLGGLEPIDGITMICVPDLMASYEQGKIDLKGVQSVQQLIIDYCEHVKYCFAILDAPPGLMPQAAAEWLVGDGTNPGVNYDSSRAALYYPWIETADMTGENGRTRVVPPCGHIAGIYARTDATRGVHKAPANEVIRGALGVDVQITRGEQDVLNPLGINAIRTFPGRGIRVWGARTLSSDPSWRYINVRRLFNMVEKSIEDGTQWIVFEPNDANLWARVSRDISVFLKQVWRSGALFGTTPEQAFYVKCDEETNPPETRDVGQLWVEIGLSPVKPAEFVIFRISQWAGPDATSD